MAIASEKLGMTLEQMEEEIELMREFDKYLKANVDGCEMMCHQFALNRSCKWLEDKGVDSSEFREKMDRYSTERS